MAQRVFLVALPVDSFADACAAIAGSAADRERVANALATRAEAHLLRVAVSECVIASAPRKSETPKWDFARKSLPYLLAGADAAHIGRNLDEALAITEQGPLEAFFRKQAKLLGVTVGGLKSDFDPPTPGELAAWISPQLERAAEVRAAALQPKAGPQDIARYAASTFIWLGRIFSRLAPTFFEGDDRWLGNAAAPDAHDGNESASAGTIAGLERILRSAADFAPSLAIADWDVFLPRVGDGNLASGGVAKDDLDALTAALRLAQRAHSIPYGSSGDLWVETVVAAALAAKKTGAHLLEADDAIYAAERWPVLD